MGLQSLVLREEDASEFSRILERLQAEAHARVVFLVSRNGEQIAAAGDLGDVDPASLGSLTAGNVAATHGLAKLIGEREFSILFHEGAREHLHISLIDGGAILLVLFDERSSLGLVRLRVRKASAELEATLAAIAARSRLPGVGEGDPDSPFAGITVEEVDALFR